MNSPGNIFSSVRQTVRYGLLMGGLIFLLKWLQWKFVVIDNALDIYIGLIAILFTTLGIWLAMQLVKPKIQTVIVEKEVYLTLQEEFTINDIELRKLNLSNREYEVLQLLVKGYSNSDIANDLFLSISTIKTHVSNLFIKMDVKSRVQAIQKAKQLKITP